MASKHTEYVWREVAHFLRLQLVDRFVYNAAVEWCDRWLVKMKYKIPVRELSLLIGQWNTSVSAGLGKRRTRLRSSKQAIKIDCAEQHTTYILVYKFGWKIKKDKCMFLKTTKTRIPHKCGGGGGAAVSAGPPIAANRSSRPQAGSSGVIQKTKTTILRHSI